ncbi:hypothetical protein [Thalassotalea litorea]|uniref:hypothetical protein n=1 Tax=Thalassotalea litorea TaxID=2020715 RepID=UPI003737088F
MEEKYQALWFSAAYDNLKVEFEELRSDLLLVIFKDIQGIYLPYLYSKESDFQYSLPVWSVKNEKAMMPSLESAKEYLELFFENYT